MPHDQKYPLILQALMDRPWAIEPAKLRTICNIVAARSAGVAATKEDIQAALAARHHPQEAPPAVGVAVIPIYGTLSHRPSAFDDMSGGTSYDRIRKSLRKAMADPAVSAVVFDVDSPGGTTDGLSELYSDIIAMRGVKPMGAVSNALTASAALYLSSAVDELAASPSSLTGSVGCVMVHVDASGWYEDMGVKFTYIHYGEHKVEGNDTTPLSDDTLAYYQNMVNVFGQQFEADIAKARGVSKKVVRDTWGKGRVLMADEAVKVGMVDRVETLEDLSARLAKMAKAGGRRSSVLVSTDVAAEAATQDRGRVEASVAIMEMEHGVAVSAGE